MGDSTSRESHIVTTSFPEELRTSLQKCGLIAVLTIEDATNAVPVAKALLAGGVSAMELTLRTPAALESLQQVKAHVPQMILGAGTVLNVQQVDAVVDAGVDFAVSPGLDRNVVEAAMSSGLPFAPGVMTPSEVSAAIGLGCLDLKFFPAEPSGGIAMLKSIAAPFSHLGVRFLPLGGVNESNAASWLEVPEVSAVGGSWLAPKSLIDARDWAAITNRAAAACELARE